MYVCVCVCVCVCLRMYVCVCVSDPVRSPKLSNHARVQYSCVCVCVCVYIHTYIRIYIHTYTCIYYLCCAALFEAQRLQLVQADVTIATHLNTIMSVTLSYIVSHHQCICVTPDTWHIAIATHLNTIMFSFQGVPQTKLQTDNLNPKLTLLLPHTIIVKCLRRPTKPVLTKETYYSVKRDLLQCQKETYHHGQCLRGPSALRQQERVVRCPRDLKKSIGCPPTGTWCQMSTLSHVAYIYMYVCVRE
jgi:hypothetical protein